MISLLNRIRFAAGIMVLLVLSACVSMPAQQMSDARQALQAADQVDAKVNASAQYELARQLLDQAQAAMKRKDFSEAKRLAIAAKEAALEARRLAELQ